MNLQVISSNDFSINMLNRLPLDDLAMHESGCDFRPIPCPFQDCQVKPAQAKIFDHVTLSHPGFSTGRFDVSLVIVLTVFCKRCIIHSTRIRLAKLQYWWSFLEFLFQSFFLATSVMCQRKYCICTWNEILEVNQVL